MDTEGPQTSQYGEYALHAGLARLYARMRMHTHTRTRKHTHTDQYIRVIAFPQQQWFRERASVLRCTYIVCIVMYAMTYFWRLSIVKKYKITNLYFTHLGNFNR